MSGGFLRLTVPSLWAILGVGGDIISASFLATVCVCVHVCICEQECYKMYIHAQAHA